MLVVALVLLPPQKYAGLP